MAGSSLLKRTITSVLLVVVLVGCLLLHPLCYTALFAAAMALMMNEFYRMAMGRGTHTALRVMMIVLCVGFFVAFILFRIYHIDMKYLLLAFPLLAVVLSAVIFDREQRIDCLTVQDLCFPLVYLLPSFLITSILLLGPDGAYSPDLFIAVIVLVWMGDVGAYATGMAFGQRENSRKLAPTISPMKSWAGAIGGVLFTVATAVCIHLLGVFSLKLWQWIVAGLLVAVFGVFGDLFESLIKRHYGVKDAGNILAGHGGLLDRFDGALFAIPVVTVFFILTGAI